MPMIMDDSLDVDDLFGDTASLGLPLPSRPSLKGLAQQVDESSHLGCQRKLAWSKSGCIASISRDGAGLNICHLQCHPKNGKWALSKEYAVDQVSATHRNQPLTHVQWSHTGQELAVLDSAGKISILNVAMAMNNLHLSRPAETDQEDDLAEVAGLQWLTYERNEFPLWLHAYKEEDQWVYPCHPRKAFGPFHPRGAALVCLTRIGQLRLLYQRFWSDNRWDETTTELIKIASSDRMITHCSISSMRDNRLMVAIQTLGRHMYVYRVQIEWPEIQKEPGKQLLSQTPTLHIEHIRGEIPPGIFKRSSDLTTFASDSVPQYQGSLQLNYLEISPGVLIRGVKNERYTWSQPMVLAVYSSLVSPTEMLMMPQQSSCVVVRWQIESSEEELHTSFDELASKKKATKPKPRLDLRRLDDTYLDRVVVAVDFADAGTTLVLAYEDGSISFYDPLTMKELTAESESDIISTMPQAGFTFPNEDTGVHIAFSPNSCMAVTLNDDWHLQLRAMEPSIIGEDASQNEEKVQRTVVSLAVAFAGACGYNYTSDDILSLAIQELNQELYPKLLIEIYRCLFKDADFTTELDQVLKKPWISKVMSLQAALGFHSRHQLRTLAAAHCWVALNVRQGSMQFAFLVQNSKQPVGPDHGAEIYRCISGNIKWSLDLFKYLLDDLFDTASTLLPTLLATNQQQQQQSLPPPQTTTLLLLLSGWSRTFLRYISRGLRGIVVMHKQLSSSPATSSTDPAPLFSRLSSLLTTSPLTIETLERLLSAIDKTIQHVFQSTSSTLQTQADVERHMLIHGTIPPLLIPAVITLLRDILPQTTSPSSSGTPPTPGIDRLALYTTDYSWLGISPDKRTESFRLRHEIDVHKKSLTKRSRAAISSPEEFVVRRCVRCCEVSEDLMPPKGVPKWMAQQMSRCICETMFTIVRAGDEADSVGK